MCFELSRQVFELFELDADVLVGVPLAEKPYTLVFFSFSSGHFDVHFLAYMMDHSFRVSVTLLYVLLL